MTVTRAGAGHRPDLGGPGRILVVAAAGAVGQEVVRRLHEQGRDVWTLDDQQLPWDVPRVAVDPTDPSAVVEALRGHLGEGGQVVCCSGPDVARALRSALPGVRTVAVGEDELEDARVDTVRHAPLDDVFPDCRGALHAVGTPGRADPEGVAQEVLGLLR